MDDFQAKVLSRLAVIESKIDDFRDTKNKADEAHILANQNKQDIDEIKDKIKWITRTIAGAIITGIIAFIFTYLKK